MSFTPNEERPVLGHLMVERLGGVPRRERHRLCDVPTLAEALVAAVRVIHGATAYATEGSRDDFPAIMRTLLVAYRLDEVEDWTQGRFRDFNPDHLPAIGRYAVIEVGHNAISEWERIATATRAWRYRGRGRRTVRRTRHDLLAFALSTIVAANYTVEDHVRDPRSRTDFVGIGVPLWWEARLAEGYTPEAAWMMLGLTIDPSVLANLGYRETQHPIVRNESEHLRSL